MDGSVQNIYLIRSNKTIIEVAHREIVAERGEWPARKITVKYAMCESWKVMFLPI
jgi:hypothetical protein